MLVEWIMAVIIAFTNAWSPRECEDGDQRCVAANEEKANGLREIAQAILDESARQELDPLMVTAIIARESSFIKEPCTKRLPMDRVIRWERDGRSNGSYTVRWRCPSSVWGPECSMRVWDAREQGDYLYFSTCSADEVGLMQIVPRSEWARAGAVVPGTERTVVGAYLVGKAGDRTVEIHTSIGDELILREVSEGVTVLRLSLPDGRDRDDDPEIWNAVVRSIEVTDTGARLRLSAALPTDLEEFSDFALATGLPSEHGPRRQMLLDPSTNIAIGCGEIAAHRSSHARPGEDWWDWIGTYNTGSRGDAARNYARRIVAQYSQMCETVVGTGENGEEIRLRDVWEPCNRVIERNKNWGDNRR